MNRRKFLGYVGCGCCNIILTSCSTVPITDRKQLKLIPEAKLNAQAALIYEKVKKSVIYFVKFTEKSVVKWINFEKNP